MSVGKSQKGVKRLYKDRALQEEITHSIMYAARGNVNEKALVDYQGFCFMLTQFDTVR
jgi:hypothetical protein